MIAPIQAFILRQAQDDASMSHSELVAPGGVSAEKEWQTPGKSVL